MTDKETETDAEDGSPERGASESAVQERSAETARDVAEQAKKLATEATRKIARRAPKRIANRLDDGDDDSYTPPDVPEPEPRMDKGPGKCPKCEEMGLHPLTRRPGYICVECDQKYSPQMLRAAQIGH